MTDIADRLWSAVCEMQEANNRVLLKDEFCRRVDEVLAASEAEVEEPVLKSFTEQEKAVLEEFWAKYAASEASVEIKPKWRDPANGDVSDAAWTPEERERIWSRPARGTVINRIKP